MQGRLWKIGLMAWIVCAAGCRGSLGSGGHGLFSHEEPLVLSGTRANMRRTVQQHIPLGTAVDDAKDVMQRNGYHCTDTQIHGAPTVVCVRGDEDHSDVRFEHRVIFWDEDGKVAKIDVQTLGFGPPNPRNPAAENQPVATETAAGG